MWPITSDQDEDDDDKSDSMAPSGIAKPETTQTTPLLSAEANSLTDGMRATPLARRLAMLGGVDIQEIEGTGRRGRIEASDIVASLKSGKTYRSKFLLLHGLGSNAMSWGALIASLEAGGDRVTAIDLPGHGQTQKTLPVLMILLITWWRTCANRQEKFTLWDILGAWL